MPPGRPRRPTTLWGLFTGRRPAHSERGRGCGGGRDSLIAAVLYPPCPLEGLLPWGPGPLQTSPLRVAGGILAGVISDRLEKRASTCGLMLLLAAPTVSLRPSLHPALPGPRASSSSHPAPQQTLSRPAQTQPHSWLMVPGQTLASEPLSTPHGPAGLPPLGAPRAPCKWLATSSFSPGSWGAPPRPSPLPHRLPHSLWDAPPP